MSQTAMLKNALFTLSQVDWEVVFQGRLLCIKKSLAPREFAEAGEQFRYRCHVPLRKIVDETWKDQVDTAP